MNNKKESTRVSSPTKTDRELLYEIANLVGAPTMDYASTQYKNRELRDRLDKVSSLIITHLGLVVPEKDPDALRENPGLTIFHYRGKVYVKGTGADELVNQSDSGKV